MSNETISILQGNTFVVSDRRGDIDASPTDSSGLFAYDTRYLSRWVLTVDGVRPNMLSTDDLDYYAVQFFLIPGTGTVYVDASLSIIRQRSAGNNGFHEDLTILNHKGEGADLSLRLDIAADFADLFEVKDALTKQGQHYQRVDREQNALVLGYQRETYIRETRVSSTSPAAFDEKGVSFSLHIEPHEQWTTALDVMFFMPGLRESAPDTTRGQVRSNMAMNLDHWLASAPKLTCEWDWLERIYKRSLIDLAALRFYSQIDPDKSLPAAGLPWFMSIFGRDSILTSLQALPFVPELAETTLLTLAAWQGTMIDDFRDEEPGKILHELRYGEMTAFEERPHSPYYGTADATPLFLILLDEYERWTGNGMLVQKLEDVARNALNWIDRYGDHKGDGYVAYDRRNKQTGLENQCWKDSWNSILFSDGSLSRLPRATCEIQGYVYDAKRRSARLARISWHDPALAEQLEQEAAILKQRFNEDFWIADRGFFALAIDGDGRKVDSLTSNIGHLLWSGIADEKKAQACVDHLMSEQLFSGWGIRTMAQGEGGYNPIGYHVGTIWPFDNSFIAWGLRRYGYKEEAARVAAGILEAAAFFKGRLPEAFGGYQRELTGFPVEYPTACSPQAWSTGTPLLLIRTMLGLEPIGDHLLVDPAVPSMMGRLEVLDIPGRWNRQDAFSRGKLDIAEARGPAQRRVV
ncbi:MAG TPA: glycogen debranching N-terminal domain-containing protein [Ktedonobacteraceae bacterium]|nr:glycogen debranching N-terminal domain-containing protein [Ktedonobacteraceae bacterium]